MRKTPLWQSIATVAPIFCAIVLGIYAAWPYLQFPGLPAQTDAELHVFRIAEVGYSLRAGNPYPRWAPDFYHGYGYPIFNYYAPLVYHLGYVLTFGRPEFAAVGAKVLFVWAHVLGSVGAYLLGRRFGSEGGGLLGAIGFSFAPYIQLINPHIRGDLAEVFSLACLPWALWGWECVWQSRETGRPLGSVVSAVLWTAATFLSHNLTGLSAILLVAAISAWRWLVERRGRSLGIAMATAAVFVLLTAFFWLPFVAERDAIMLDVAGEGHYDFHNHFVRFRELLKPMGRIDHRSTSIGVPMTVGPQILAFALLGVLLKITQSAKSPRGSISALGPYLVLTALCLLLVTECSLPIWESVPGLAYFQFPWRFLGPLAVLLIPLLATLGRIRRFRWVLAAAAAILLVAGAYGLYPIPWASSFGPITQQAIVQAELQGRWRGTTSTNDFVPSTVDMIPGPEAQVLASYEDPPVDRVNRYTLPKGAQVEVVPDVPWVNRFNVTTDEAFILRLFLFDFPGWQATIDGRSVPIEVAHPEGFITIRVPPGDHEVVVRFRDTAVRRLAWAVTGMGVTAFGVLLVALGRSRLHPHQRLDRQIRGAGYEDTASAHHSPNRLARRDEVGTISIALVVVMFGILKVGLFDPLNLLSYTSPEGESYAATHHQKAYLGDEIALLGYDLSTHRLRSGGRLDVTLYWSAQREMTRTYQSFVHLVYPEDEIRAQSDHLNPGGFPTDRWPTDRYVRDVHQLRLPADAPPGPYLLSVGIYSLVEDTRLPVRSAECGQRLDSVILCQTITVRR
ncbi:MAG: 6-pyruvoyl-tetrahydropterin synthase-related protein [Anaerolineae bacterium]